MPRITPVAPKDAGPLIKLGYRMARRQLGEVPEPFAVLAHHRKLFFASARDELALQKVMNVVPDSLIQLAVYRTAWTVGRLEGGDDRLGNQPMSDDRCRVCSPLS